MLRYFGLPLAILGCLSSKPSQALTYSNTTLDDGTFVISVNGEFSPNEEFSGFLQATELAGDKRIIVTFDSVGGNPTKAIALGRIIRLLKLPTIQLRGTECASACALAFMGGLVRYAAPGSIGVHKSSFADTKNLSVENAVSAVQQQTAETVAFMSEMGVDPSILQLSLSYESDDIRYLSKSEMERFRIITDANSGPSAPTEVSVTRPAIVPPPPVPTNTPPQTQAMLRPLNFTIPTARTGKIRVPKGYEHLRFAETQQGPKGIRVRNGDSAHILKVGDKWYQVRVRGEVGYLHHNWVKVDQFVNSSFEHRFVQIKSFNNRYEAEHFIISSNLPFSAYLATNGWYAVTLDSTFTTKRANTVLDELKAKDLIPEDAFVTTGNTYMAKTCCVPLR